MTPQLIFLLNQSLQYLRTGNSKSAGQLLSQAYKISPKNPDVLRLLGITEFKNGAPKEAIKFFEKALRYAPKNGIIFSNMGNVLFELKRYDEALAAHSKAISLAPEYAEAYSNMGNVLFELKRYDEALAAHSKAISLAPEYAEAYSNMGNVLFDRQCYLEAIPLYEKTLALNPSFDYVLGRLAYAKMFISNWDGLDEIVYSISEKLESGKRVSPPFDLLPIIDSPKLLLNASKTWCDDKYPPVKTTNYQSNSRHNKIRVGYFSSDFYNHATAHLMMEFFELHDKNKFEIFAFSFGPHIDDASRQRIKDAFDHFIEISDISDKDVATLCLTLELDIAIDLKGYTQHSRSEIFSQRVAPIQINYLGYPGTMGSPYIDYIIADAILIPSSSRDFYTEKIIYLPSSYQVNDSKRPISNSLISRSDFGLPENGIVFCSFNNSYKITPTIFDSWSRILKNVEGSVLWLLAANPTAKRNLIEEALKRGLSGDQLIFAERIDTSEHLARHRLADLFIDTSPCNAHTTTSDALWAGLPVLTLLGNTFAGRVAASLISAIGLPELITTTQSEYESMAINLGNNPDKLKEIRGQLDMKRLSSPLFNTPLTTQNIESAYLAIYDRYQTGLAPDHIYIN